MINIPLISIIVPAYNAGSTLALTIDAILSQSISNYELIIVDDGSIDNTSKICERYTANKKIRVVKQENKGVSNARNLGIELANGDWITFVDADDVVKQDYLKNLIDSVISNKTDFAMSNVIAINVNHNEQLFEIPTINYCGSRGMKEFLNQYIDHPILKVNHAKLYKREIIEKNRIRYRSKVRLSEDALFVIEYLSNVKSVSIVSNADYIYYQPLNLEFKYKLTFEEAVYKCVETEKALMRLEELYNCSFVTRKSKNWHRSIGCISLEQYIDDVQYEKILGLYAKYCQTYEIKTDLNCNRYLKFCYNLAYNPHLSIEDRKKLCHFIQTKGANEIYDIDFAPKKMQIIHRLSRICGSVLLLCILTRLMN